MAKLNQILAIEKTEKTQLHKHISALHHATQKPQLVNGHHKVFHPKEEDGETFPDDKQVVQHRYIEAIEQVTDYMAKLMDVTATKDFANVHAKADVVVDGVTLIPDAPVSYLLFLEKELQDLYTFVEKIVELDPAETWTHDDNLGLYRSEPVKTQRTAKRIRPIVKYDATEHHPAQTELITEDVVIGHWTTTKYSGAIPRPQKKAILQRISTVIKAVKFAREQANGVEAERQHVGRAILNYIFAE